MCLSCQKAYRAEHYKKNKADYVAKAVQQRVRNRSMVRGLKSKRCADCGVSYPYWVMSFDHVRGEKLGNIASMVLKKGKAWLLAEVAKCDVVCANCHAERTHQRERSSIR